MSLTLPLNGQPGMDGERRGRKREKREEEKSVEKELTPAEEKEKKSIYDFCAQKVLERR